MRFMVMVKATKNSEAGVLPKVEMFEAMHKYNEQLLAAGIMKSGDGLRPSRDGARVHFSGSKRTVIDGPFPETKELVAGYWLWECKDLKEAIEWVKKCPNPMPGEDSDIEIRPFYEMEDFGDQFTPEARARVEEMRKQLPGQ